VQLDKMKHSISQALCSSKANIVQPAMTASSQGNILKSEVGYSDCGEYLENLTFVGLQLGSSV
jgi:hypothetical protein